MKLEESIRQNTLRHQKPLVYEKVKQYGMRMVRIEPSYICNMHCLHCCIRDLQTPQDRRTITIADIQSIAKQADEIGFAQFVISGGEPMIYPDFDDMVKAINPKKFWIVTDSNGWYLDRERAFHLKTIGVDKIQLSIDSIEVGKHDQFRQKPGAYDRAIKAIGYCQDAGLNLIVQTVIPKSRVHTAELMAFIEYFNGLGCPIYLSFAKPAGAWKGRYDVMINQDDFDFIASLEKDHNVFTHLTPQYDYPGGCTAVKRMINIDKWGAVTPCAYMRGDILGNIFDEPLKDINARGMARFSAHMPTCPVAMDEEYVRGNFYDIDA